MLNVTTDFKNTIKQSAVYSDGYVEITNSDGTITFESKDLTSIEIYGSAFENDKVLGSLAQHSLTLDLLGDLTSTISLSKENVIKAYIGVRVDSINYEYVQYQNFIVTSVVYSDTQNVTRIIATDYLVKLNKEYVDSNTYPLTLKSYLENVLSSCGLQLENTTFFNDDFVIDSQKIVDLTSCKEIVSKVAEMALCFAMVNKSSNKIQLVPAFDPFMRGYTHDELSSFTHEELSALTHYDIQNAITLEDESISKSNYWSFKLSDHWFKTYGINTLTLKVSYSDTENNSVQNDDYVSIDGNVELSIIDNPFINTETLRLSVIDDMFNEVLGYKYNPYTLEYRGFPYLEVGDIVDITRLDETSFGSPIYEMTIRYDGGLYGKLAAQALSQTETTYKNTQTLAQRVKTAEVIVNKVDGEITLIASEVSDLDSQVSTLTLDVGSIELSVSDLSGDVSTLDGQVSALTLDVNGLEIVVGDYEDGKLVGTYYNFDGDGFSMTNSDEEVVFSADSNGNLTFTGKIEQYTSGTLRMLLDNDSLEFYKPNGDEAVIFTTNEYGLIISSDTSLTLDAYSNILLQDDVSGYNTTALNSFASSSIHSHVSAQSNVTFASTTMQSINASTVASILTTSYGNITLQSTSEWYVIYIDGALRNITREAGTGYLVAS